MKKSKLGNITFLVAACLLALWLNWDESIVEKAIGPHATVNEPENFVLAVSWQPAFCERRPNVVECRSQRAGRFDVENFSLHGLWPQTGGKTHCGVSRNLVDVDKAGRWRDLPDLHLSEALREELAKKMPGYRSFLHRHEWYKHGTCIPGMLPEDYFGISLQLLDQLNASDVANTFSENINKRLEFRDVENAFKKSFGNGTTGKFIVDCYRDDGRRIIQELKLSIGGALGLETSLAEALERGQDVGRSCPSGIIDAVGIQ